MNKPTNKSTKSVAAGLVFCFALSLSACTSVHPPSGYLSDYSQLAKGEHFRQEYVYPEADLTKYTKAKVNPVELKYFSSPYEKLTQEELDRLATKLKASLETQLGKKYQILANDQTPDPETFVVSPALVFISTPERLINLATFWLIGFTFSKGSAAFEAKLLDGQSGKVIAQFAERRKSGGGITDIKSILIGGWFRFIHAEGAFKRWGKEIREMTLPPSEK